MSRAILGGIELSVVDSDDPNRSVDVTEKPVESGQDIADHVKQKPDSISISGVVVGDDAWSKLKKLKDLMKKGELLTYTNRIVYSDVVIEKLNTSHNVSTRNGYEFSITLKQVRVATAKEASVTAGGKAAGTKTKKVSNAGTKQAKSR